MIWTIPPQPGPRRVPASAPLLYAALEAHFRGELGDDAVAERIGALRPQIQAEIDAIGPNVAGLGERDLSACPRCRRRGTLRADDLDDGSIGLSCEAWSTAGRCGWLGRHGEHLQAPWGRVR